MASVDLDRLCHCLSSIAVDQLYSLGDEEFLCGLKIRGHPLPVVVSMIRGHLTAIRITNSRLSEMCAIYSSLMAKNLIRPWVLYHVPLPKATLVMQYLIEMDSNRGFAHSLKIWSGTTHMCGLVPESDDPNTAHQLYCFCFWAAQKCVAVYRPPEGYSNAEKQFLAKMFGGDPIGFARGTFNDLDSAHQAAVALAQPQPS